jgi:RNA polymerase sigma-70 factor, ECF subfamily
LTDTGMTDSEALEKNLILRTLGGRDDRAYGQLVIMHQSRVRALLRRLCGNVDSADDLAQEVFVIAHQKLPSYKGQGRFGAWLCSIAYRQFLQSYRQQRRERDVQLDYQAWQAATLATTAPDDNAGQIDLERALLNLPSVESAAITLNMTLGYSHQEVAAVMQLPLGTVKSHIRRGLEKLKQQLSSPTEQGPATVHREQSA